MVHQAVAIQHGVDRANGRQVRAGELLPELFADLGRAPAGILPLQAHDRGLKGRRQPIRLPVRSMAPVAKGLNAAVLVTVEDLVAGLAGNPELGAQRRHLLALEQAGDKSESLVHDVTLLPRHAPSWWGQSVTHPLGIRCYLSLRKDSSCCDHAGATAREPTPSAPKYESFASNKGGPGASLRFRCDQPRPTAGKPAKRARRSSGR